MSETFYLGHTDYKPKPYTRINCIAKAINGAWKKQSLIDELPAVGKVFAPSLAWVEENQLIANTTQAKPKQVDDDVQEIEVQKHVRDQGPRTC